MSDQKPGLAVIESQNVFAAYVNAVANIEFDGTAFTLTFGHTRMTGSANGAAPASAQCHVVARLTPPPAGAVDLANKVSAMMKRMSEMQAEAQAQAQVKTTTFQSDNLA